MTIEVVSSCWSPCDSGSVLAALLALPFGSLEKMNHFKMHIFHYFSRWFVQHFLFSPLPLGKTIQFDYHDFVKRVESTNSIQALASKAGAAPKEGEKEAEAASEESSSPLGDSVGLALQPVDMLNITLKIGSVFLTITTGCRIIDEQYGKGLRSLTITKEFSFCEELLKTTGLKNRKRKKRRNTKRGQLRSAFSKMLQPFSLAFSHILSPEKL